MYSGVVDYQQWRQMDLCCFCRRKSIRIVQRLQAVLMFYYQRAAAGAQTSRYITLKDKVGGMEADHLSGDGAGRQVYIMISFVLVSLLVLNFISFDCFFPKIWTPNRLYRLLNRQFVLTANLAPTASQSIFFL